MYTRVRAGRVLHGHGAYPVAAPADVPQVVGGGAKRTDGTKRTGRKRRRDARGRGKTAPVFGPRVLRGIPSSLKHAGI